MSRQRREGEPDHGKKLTPGERVKNWASAAVTAWPIMITLLGLLGYTNKEELGITALAQPDGVTEIGNHNFQEQVQQFSRETVEKLNQLSSRVHRLEAQTKSDDGSLQSQINDMKAEMQKWHGQ